MRTKVSLFVVGASVVAAICTYYTTRERLPSDAASASEQGSTNGGSAVLKAAEGSVSAKAKQVTGSGGQATATGERATGTGAQVGSAARPQGESAQEQVLAMYDVIVDELERTEGDCDAMGTALSSTIDAHASDVQRWLSEQRQLTAEQRAELEKQLDTTAAERVKSAQEAMREGLGKCAANAKFIGAFQKLASLTPAG